MSEPNPKYEADVEINQTLHYDPSLCDNLWIGSFIYLKRTDKKTKDVRFDVARLEIRQQEEKYYQLGKIFIRCRLFYPLFDKPKNKKPVPFPMVQEARISNYWSLWIFLGSSLCGHRVLSFLSVFIPRFQKNSTNPKMLALQDCLMCTFFLSLNTENTHTRSPQPVILFPSPKTRTLDSSTTIHPTNPYQTLPHHNDASTKAFGTVSTPPRKRLEQFLLPEKSFV